MASHIKDSNLWESGELKLSWARRLQPGHVITDEPGIYFIPALIEKFKREGLGRDFVNYAKLEAYYDFGGIRLEDDVLITPDGARLKSIRMNESYSLRANSFAM